MLSQQGWLEGEDICLRNAATAKTGLNLGNWGGLCGYEQDMHVVTVYKQHTCRRSRARKVELHPCKQA